MNSNTFINTLQVVRVEDHMAVIEDRNRLAAELAEAHQALRDIWRAQYRNGRHGNPPMVSVDDAEWTRIGLKFSHVINARAAPSAGGPQS